VKKALERNQDMKLNLIWNIDLGVVGETILKSEDNSDLHNHFPVPVHVRGD